MNSSELANFVDEFEKNPEMDIPETFLEQLQLYEKYAGEYDIQIIAKQFSFIPKNIEKIINNFYLCSEMQICDLVVSILFKFITSRGVSDLPAIWASSLIRKLAVQKELVSSVGVPAKIAIKAIQNYPQEYLKLLDDKALNILALSNPPSFIVEPLLEEIDKRNIEIPQNMLNKINFNEANFSPHLVKSIFEFFIKEPSIQFGNNIVSFFATRPQLHVFLTHDLSMYNLDAVVGALQTLGKSIQSAMPFKFPLSYLYSPKIRDLVDEIEHYFQDPASADKGALVSILQSYSDNIILFTLPLLIEFPEWFSILKELDDRINALSSRISG